VTPRLVLVLASALLGLACNQSTLNPLPDAGGPDACEAHAVIFCDAGAPGSGGCVGGGTSDPNVALLPSDASFPVGCTANITGTERNNVTGFCNLVSQCTCQGDLDAGDAAATPPAWACSP
jgi:hypothetical protein